MTAAPPPATGPITETEHAALLAALGNGFPLHGQVLQAYRAGVRDGGRAVEPRVFRVGDPQPAEPVALMDSDHTVEIWDPTRPRCGWTWARYLEAYEPLITVTMPDFAAVVQADEQRRRGEAR